jgi:hypothetical protein
MLLLVLRGRQYHFGLCAFVFSLFMLIKVDVL